MEVKAIALKLPNPEKFLIIKMKLASNEEPIKWRSSYRDQFFAIQEMVGNLHSNRGTQEITSDQREALINEAFTSKEAEESIECVWVDADTTRKSPVFLDRYEDSVSIGGYVGYNVQGGMERFALVVNGTGAVLTRDMLLDVAKSLKAKWTAINDKGKEVPLSRYEPGDTVIDPENDNKLVNFDNPEMRSMPYFYKQAQRYKGKGLAGNREFRFLTIPYGYRVSIVATRSREVLREIPKQWS